MLITVTNLKKLNESCVSVDWLEKCKKCIKFVHNTSRKKPILN